jgi:hypothetical protein
MAKGKSASEALLNRYGDELLTVLRKTEELERELREEVKERKEEILTYKRAQVKLRMLIEGTAPDQLEVPGTEVPEIPPPEAKRLRELLERSRRQGGDAP